MLSPHRIALVLLSFGAFLSARAASAEADWPDGKGGTFRGEPVEALGPLLVFRTGPGTGRSQPARLMPPADCARFYQAIASRPGRAGRWSEAKGAATAELVGRMERVEGGKSKRFDFAGAPEPELLIVLFGGNQTAPPPLLLDNLAPFLSRVDRLYPGRVASVVSAYLPEIPVASQRTWLDGRGLPTARAWLVAEPASSRMKLLSRFTPGNGFAITLMTRDGVPLISGAINSVGQIMAFVDDASDLLWQLNPANPRSARDRQHYLRAARPVEFAQGKAEPLLLIDPFRADTLRQRGIARVEATLDIGPDGAVTRAELLAEAEIPAPLTGAIGEALRRGAIFLPALADGQPVAGTARYSLKVEAPTPQLTADAAWVNGEARREVPLPAWLVLKSIEVAESKFVITTVNRVAADGRVVLNPVKAGSSDVVSKTTQKNAFNSDWFESEGAASVRPVIGAKQEVDGKTFTWKRLVSDRGLVDLLDGSGPTSHDFSIAYAWTEFDSPADTDAWLGIGSDDGLKVWCNGELVNDRWVGRTSRLDDDVVPLRLKQGKNQLLLKVQNQRGYWSFTARLRVRGN